MFGGEGLLASVLRDFGGGSHVIAAQTNAMATIIFAAAFTHRARESLSIVLLKWIVLGSSTEFCMVIAALPSIAHRRVLNRPLPAQRLAVLRGLDMEVGQEPSRDIRGGNQYREARCSRA